MAGCSHDTAAIGTRQQQHTEAGHTDRDNCRDCPHPTAPSLTPSSTPPSRTVAAAATCAPPLPSLGEGTGPVDTVADTSTRTHVTAATPDRATGRQWAARATIQHDAAGARQAATCDVHCTVPQAADDEALAPVRSTQNRSRTPVNVLAATTRDVTEQQSKGEKTGRQARCQRVGCGSVNAAVCQQVRRSHKQHTSCTHRVVVLRTLNRVTMCESSSDNSWQASTTIEAVD
jgi:hypothetical protein